MRLISSISTSINPDSIAMKNYLKFSASLFCCFWFLKIIGGLSEEPLTLINETICIDFSSGFEVFLCKR
jgi:hypothetical protein